MILIGLKANIHSFVILGLAVQLISLLLDQKTPTYYYARVKIATSLLFLWLIVWFSILKILLALLESLFSEKKDLNRAMAFSLSLSLLAEFELRLLQEKVFFFALDAFFFLFFSTKKIFLISKDGWYSTSCKGFHWLLLPNIWPKQTTIGFSLRKLTRNNLQRKKN